MPGRANVHSQSFLPGRPKPGELGQSAQAEVERTERDPLSWVVDAGPAVFKTLGGELPRRSEERTQNVSPRDPN